MTVDQDLYPSSPRDAYLRDVTLAAVIAVLGAIVASHISDSRGRLHVLENRVGTMRNEVDLARRQAREAREVADSFRNRFAAMEDNFWRLLHDHDALERRTGWLEQHNPAVQRELRALP